MKLGKASQTHVCNSQERERKRREKEEKREGKIEKSVKTVTKEPAFSIFSLFVHDLWSFFLLLSTTTLACMLGLVILYEKERVRVAS